MELVSDLTPFYTGAFLLSLSFFCGKFFQKKDCDSKLT